MGWGRECDLLSSSADLSLLLQGRHTIGGPPPPNADLGLEVGFDLVNLGELGERPAAVAAKMIHVGHPIGVIVSFLPISNF